MYKIRIKYVYFDIIVKVNYHIIMPKVIKPKKEDRLMTRCGRQEIYQEIEGIRERSVRGILDDIVGKGEEYGLKAMGVMAEMVPDAAETVYEVMKFGESKDQVRLKAAMFVLGIFGVSEKKQVEVTHRDGDAGDKKKLMEDLKNEFRRQIERAQFERSKRVSQGDEEGAILIEPSGPVP